MSTSPVMTRSLAYSAAGPILVAEEDRSLRLALQEALRTLGYPVVLAEDALQAGVLLEDPEEAFRVVVADYATAEAGGLLGHSKESNSSVPVVVLTPQGEPHLLHRARASGASAALSKPVRMASLRAVLESVAGNSTTPPEE